jgi:hypothetical protein
MTGGVVAVRPMREGDIEAVSAVRVTSWKAAYAGLVPAGYLDRMSVTEDARKRRERFDPDDSRTANLVGFHRVVLWVLAGNTRARAFYEAWGFTPDGTSMLWQADDEPLSEVRYCRTLFRWQRY